MTVTGRLYVWLLSLKMKLEYQGHINRSQMDNLYYAYLISSSFYFIGSRILSLKGVNYEYRQSCWLDRQRKKSKKCLANFLGWNRNIICNIIWDLQFFWCSIGPLISTLRHLTPTITFRSNVDRQKSLLLLDYYLYSDLELKQGNLWRHSWGVLSS